MDRIHDCSEIEQSWTLKEELREILEEEFNEKSLFFDQKGEKMGFFNELFGGNNNGPRDYDRVDHNSDGRTFYGYDDKTGHTDWYDENNELDSRTETPDEDDY